MADTSRQSLATALSFILEGSGIIVLDYCNADTFRDLWLDGLTSETPEINGQALNWQASKQTIVIVGNEPSGGIFDNTQSSLKGINFQDHFTASSWLAAWKVKFTNARTAIAVIDSRDAGLATGPARSLQTILAARDVEVRSLIPGATIFNAPSLKAICQWLNASKTDARETSPHLRDLLKSTIWNELTSNRDKHHALSNVLGAFLLQAEVGGKNPDSETKQTQEYLDALLQSCGTAVKPSGAGSGGWITKEVRDSFDGAVLIDDMAEIWAGFLVSAFGSGGGDSVRTTRSGGFANAIEGISPSPDNESLTGLAGRLSDFLTSGRPRLFSADLIPADTPDRPEEKKTPEPWQNFVLFLDLRLGLGERFQKQLLRVGTALLLLTSRHLPWLTDANRAKFKAELESGRTDETLLPRLIALLDPTLPIVIFSSTHRTELIGSFRDYGNIITAFRKPILTGLTREWTEVVNELRSDFVSALDAASGILSTRKLLADLEPVEPLAV